MAHAKATANTKVVLRTSDLSSLPASHRCLTLRTGKWRALVPRAGRRPAPSTLKTALDLLTVCSKSSLIRKNHRASFWIC